MKKNEMTKKLMEEFNEDFIDVGGSGFTNNPLWLQTSFLS